MSTYAFSDIHGDYSLFTKIKEYIKENDIVYCLGDCCDRGKYGIEIIQEILQDNRFILLLGNHEQMLIEYYEKQKLDSMDLTLMKYNESDITYHKLKKLSLKEQQNFIDKLKKLPVYTKYINKDNQIIYLSHSGSNLSDFLKSEKENKIENKNSFIWNREHYLELDKEFSINDNDTTYIVHGHTPSILLNQILNRFPQKKEKIVRYNYGNKIDIDLYTYETKRIALLDLDTLNPIYFEK